MVHRSEERGVWIAAMITIILLCNRISVDAYLGAATVLVGQLLDLVVCSSFHVNIQ